MLRRAGVMNVDNEKRCRYQADCLGRENGETLLSELLPYPSPNTKVWAYSARFENRECMIDNRITLLKQTFAKSRFELAVGYGTANWPHYERVFEVSTWSRRAAFRIGNRDNMRIVLAPHFSSQAYNTSEQLDEFAAVALKGT